LVIGFLVFTVPGLEAKEIKVKCDKGESVQKELDKLDGPATIVVTGTCHEYLHITKDDVTIQGGTYLEPTPSDPSKNMIWVRGARRILITGVTVEKGYNGIAAGGSASLTLENSTISNAANNGVVSYFGASVTVNSSTIQGNLYGATATDNSAIIVTDSHIRNNTGTGIVVVRSSSARVGQNILGQQIKNSIIDNGGSGVYIGRSSHGIIDGNTIDNNTGSGVSIEGASATVINNEILSNGANGIDVYGSGHARIGITDGSGGYGKNLIKNNGRDGVKISDGSNAFVLGNDIKNNGQGTNRNGIGIYRGTCGLIGDNTIQGNKGHGISISQGTLFQGKGDWSFTPGRDIIRQNNYSGILAWNNASLDIRSVTVTDNTQTRIVLSLQSTLRIYNSTVSGHHSPYSGIYLNRGSAIILDNPSGISPAIVTNNTGWGVFCGDAESSLAGDTSGVTGNGTPPGSANVNCAGF
jgi:parallel beta-helix repeat protein